MAEPSEQDETGFALINLLPNALTITAICAGMSAIRFGVQGNYVLAVQLIIAAWGYALTGQLGKALTSATLSAMAYAGASLINNLQQGGTVPGGYGGGDKLPAMVEPGEMVITKENVRRNRALLTRVESGTATMPIYVYLGTKLIYKEITKAINETNEIKIRAR